ncbi:MAG: hypothetical protein VKK03_03290 [Synechococcus sp.]|nr:hypothetical protein [Synechococcus sp.]
MTNVGNPRRGTSLKWESNGELAGADLRHILQRLQDADPQAQGLNSCEFGCDLAGHSSEPPQM